MKNGSGILSKLFSAFKDAADAVMPFLPAEATPRDTAIEMIIARWHDHEEKEFLKTIPDHVIRAEAAKLVDKIACEGLGDSSTSSATLEDELLAAEYIFFVENLEHPLGQYGREFRCRVDGEFEKLYLYRDEESAPAAETIIFQPHI